MPRGSAYSMGELSWMAAAEAGIRARESAFATPEVYLDPARLKSTQEELSRLRSELALLEEEWLWRQR